MRRLRLAFALLGTIAATWAAELRRMAPATAAKLVAEQKAVLVDVREPEEWRATGVAQPAVLLPQSDFNQGQAQWKPFLAALGGKQVILYCHSGRRAAIIGEALASRGFNVANAGGFKEWTSAGLPVRRIAPAASPKK